MQQCGSSQYECVDVNKMSGLEDHLFAFLDEDENMNLTCALADGVLIESAMILMQIKLYADTIDGTKYL